MWKGELCVEQVMICALLPHPPMMIPEIGKDELDKMQDTVNGAERAARMIKEQNPQTIIVVTPHGPVVDDCASISIHPRLKGNFGDFGASDLIMGFETDDLLTRHILRQTDRLGINVTQLTDDIAKNHRLSLELDYGSLVPLYYLSKAGFKGQLVQISVGILSYEELYTFGKAVQLAVTILGKRVSVIASGNLSHNGVTQGLQAVAAKKFDLEILQAVQELAVKKLFSLDPTLIAQAGECGLRPIAFLMGIVGGMEATTELLAYEAPLGVGYGIVVIHALTKAKKRRRP